MALLLLIVIYIGYMGLGLPNSVFGALWPSVQADLNLPIDAANYVTLVISGCTVISVMFGARAVNKLGTPTVVTSCTIIAALSLLGFSVSGNILTMCLFSIPLGLSIGAIDSSLNNYIALHYKAMHMNFLHCFFGIGIMASPYIISLILDDKGWRYGYRAIFLVQAAIALVLIIGLPLWKCVKHSDNESEEEVEYKNLSYLKMAKTPTIVLDWIMCISVNVIEAVCGVWGSMYLVKSHSMGEASAAAAITFFYGGMALGRFLSGLISNKVSSWKIIFASTALMIAGALMLPVSNMYVAVAGLFLLGIGNGPVYPNIMHLTPKHFGKEVSGSVLGSQMATAYLGFTIGPVLFGSVAGKIGTGFLPIYIGVWLLVFVASAVIFLEKKRL